MYVLLDLRGQISSFIHISDCKMTDTRTLDIIISEAGDIYMMDRGYIILLGSTPYTKLAHSWLPTLGQIWTIIPSVRGLSTE